MTAPSEGFIDGAYGTLNALRLFAHNSRLPETVFYIAEGIRGDIIQFRSIQCWCDISRDAEGVTIKITPINETAQNFVGRILKLPRTSYHASRIMTQSDEEMFAGNGRAFATLVAELFDLHQRDSRMVPYHLHGKDHVLFVAAMTEKEARLVNSVDQIANSANHRLSAAGLTVHISHPAFDLPGGIKFVDANDCFQECPPIPAADPFARQMAQLDAAAKTLPPTLRFDLLELGFPATYGVMPHAYTLALSGDRASATIQAMKASAELGIDQSDPNLLAEYQVTVICTKPAKDPEARARAIILEDWASKPDCFIAPTILATKVELETETHFEVHIRLLADRESAASYNETGCYDVLPA